MTTDTAPQADAALGSDAPEQEPEPLTFDALPLTPEVRAAIDEMGWTEPTPVQVQSYPLGVEGKDLLVQSRTGTGKTGAFGIPVVDRIVTPGDGFQALILAPTRELALQSAREVGKLGKRRGLRTCAVYGGASMEKQIRELDEGAEIVSGTPGRVLDHLRRGTLDPSGMRILVLDEADEMLSMGFAKELNAILELLPREKQTFLFSATIDGPVTRMAERHMNDPETLALSGDAVGALGVTHYMYMVTGVGRAQDLVKILEVEDPESAVIFCNTKAETEQVAAALQNAGFNADWLNGDLAQNEREKVMGRTREGKLRYLVATDVAARGIDISHLTHVVNYSLPQHLEQYIHRTGRTGRAGRTGTAIALVSPQDLGNLYYLRLQYKIVPIERSLPSSREQRTRVEADRVALLQQGLPKQASAMDRAVARRLLAHGDAEALLARLLASFFGPQGSDAEIDENAAEKRRARTPEPVAAEPEKKAPKRDKPKKKKKKAAASDEGDAPTKNDADEERPRARPRNDDDDELAVLYVNVGRRDGARASDVAALVEEVTGLGRDDVGRIRVREKHSFVHVPTGEAERTLDALNAATYGDRDVVAEPARQNG